MSLLNEMLHDLAKQKPANLAKPSLTAALMQPKNQRISLYILGCTGLALVLLVFLVFKPGFHKSNVVNNNQSKPLSTFESDVVSSEVANSNDVPSTRTLVSHSKEAAAENIYQNQTKEEWLDSEMNKALQALNEGHIKNAKSLLQGILSKEPGLISAREKLSLIYLSYGNYGDATKVLNEGLEYAPEDPDLITVKAKILIGQNKTDEAIQLLKGDHPYIVSHPDFYATLAMALETKGDIEEAGTYYKSLIKVDPNNGKYWLGYAISLESTNQTIEAINAFKRASQNSITELAIHKQAENHLKALVG